MIELLAPAGNMEKLLAALHYGADAIYLAGKDYGLRAFTDNFDYEDLKTAIELCHERGKKVYVTLNIFARNRDFDGLKDYLQYLETNHADAVIVSDAGIVSFIKKHAPALDIHLSTQANTTNKYAAEFWADLGIKRIVLARELTLKEIGEIGVYLNGKAELEAFVHGAMCISYSGRCLLSDFMTGRHSNKGACAQSCRWEYAIAEKVRGEYLPVEEDGRGTYILNSRDMNMIEHLKDLSEAGISSFKIEGRVKSSFYVASVVNAYRKAIDLLQNGGSGQLPQSIKDGLVKTGHRKFCTGFYFNDPNKQCFETSKQQSDYDFIGLVKESLDGAALVEMRNRFKLNDRLEILSPSDIDGESFTVGEMINSKGENITLADQVQENVTVKTDLKLSPFDMLIKKK